MHTSLKWRLGWVDLGRLPIALVALAFTGTAGASVLVVSPHPDDDILTSAGVLARAVARGEAVRVAFVTNGDGDGLSYGALRQGEAVAAEAELGIAEDELVFLGYPDNTLADLYYYYPNATDVVSHYGQTTTYASRGLGRTDYHTYRTGAPAAYNGYNLREDLVALLGGFHPDHVIVSSAWDGHPDHQATYRFVREAVQAVRLGDPGFDPVLHRTVVWSGFDPAVWPNAASPATEFDPVPMPAGSTLVWSERESLDVPLAMQSTDLPANPKYLAIGRHVSQGGNGSYLGHFLHRDEIFWPEQVGGNHPPVANAGADQAAARGATVTLNGTGSFDLDGTPVAFHWRQASGYPVTLADVAAPAPTFVVPAALAERGPATFELVVDDGVAASLPDAVTVDLGTDILPPENLALRAAATASSENAAFGQLAVKAIDGVVDGTPGDYTREWATFGQGAGAWIQLAWSTPQLVGRVVLYDRPNLDDWIAGGRLVFGDGSTVAVGALDNAGGPTAIEFAARPVTSIRFEIAIVGPNTLNAGLAEFQVFPPAVPPANLPPVAIVGPDQHVGEDATVTLHGEASYDYEGQPLGYSWTQTAGPSVTLAGPGTATPTFRTPLHLAAPVVYSFQLVVGDGARSSDPTVTTVYAAPTPPPNLALAAAATASSEVPGQEAAKAIDGYTDGYPVNGLHEWSSAGQGAGAWIQLTWPTAQLSDRIVLYDRPNGQDQILAATLTFSDGFSVPVGPLDNAGAAVPIAFSPRYFVWVRLAVDLASATTGNVGLAEFQVLGAAPPANLPPVAAVGGPIIAVGGETVQLQGDASYDPEGAPLTYAWTQTLGPAVSLSSATAPNPTFVAPVAPIAQELAFQLVVTDGELPSDPGTATVTVQPPPPPPNLALRATASASSQNAAAGQLAASAIDGYIDGAPGGNRTHEWATAGEGVGAWLRLDWALPQTIGSAVLHDRPNSADQVRAGTLEFGDGTSVPVGTLGNGGAGATVAFSPRVVTWLRFVVTAVKPSTTAIGLAELEVLGVTTAGNLPPVAVAGDPQTVGPGDPVQLSGTASYDPEGRPLSYAWTQTLGPTVALAGATTATPTFVAPAGVQPEPLAFALVVSDGALFSQAATATVTVRPPLPPPGNLAPAAFASASSENATTGQLASRAIDGYLDGEPNGDPTHEWATLGEGAGAWLELRWPAPVTVGAVVLYDRPNGLVQVRAGTLEFSNGTRIPVGALDNGGTGTRIAFTPRTVTWLRFTVTRIKGTKPSVGLAEVEVYR